MTKKVTEAAEKVTGKWPKVWRLGGILTDPRVEWSRGNLGGSI